MSKRILALLVVASFPLIADDFDRLIKFSKWDFGKWNSQIEYNSRSATASDDRLQLTIAQDSAQLAVTFAGVTSGGYIYTNKFVCASSRHQGPSLLLTCSRGRAPVTTTRDLPNAIGAVVGQRTRETTTSQGRDELLSILITANGTIRIKGDVTRFATLDGKLDK